jgi:hypothetical protein
LDADRLSILLALNGALVLLACMGAGLLLYRSILARGNLADWHLLHAGGTSRGVLLIALAATVHLADLSDLATVTAAMLILYFVWTSVLAMFLRALTGETGYRFAGRTANRIVFVLYGTGVVAVFVGFGIWSAGLLDALNIGAAALP